MDQNQEDKENINATIVTPKNRNRKKNETTKKLNRHLFSPDMGELSKVFENIQFSGIEFSSNEKNMVVTNSQTDSHSVNNVELKEKEKKKEENFDPMKPRHQLSRTPPKKLEKSLEIEIPIQPQLHSKRTLEVISSRRYQGILIFLIKLIKLHCLQNNTLYIYKFRIF